MKLYVSTEGSDRWTGALAQPNEQRTDGPFRSIERAKQEVRELKRTANISDSITVELRGGTYHISEPIVFEPEDTAPVTYTSYPGETAILDGGKRIEGWKETKLGSLTVWTVQIPEVVDGSWYFRQLFVNGERRNRPRLPKQGFYWMEDVPGMTFEDDLFKGSRTFQYAGNDIQNWSSLQDIDVIVPHFWTDEHMPIQSVDEDNRLVTSSHQSVFVLKDDFVNRYPKYYVENVYEALSEPGEWYLHHGTGQLTYIPMPGESLGECEIIAPIAYQLLKFAGDPIHGKLVEFVKFNNIIFQHTDWHLGDQYNYDFSNASPLINYAAGPQGAIHLPGVIAMTGARNCAIEKCIIRHVGWYGIELSEGCQSIRVIGNEIYDLGAGGVKVCGADLNGPLANRSGNHKITDNHIYSGGRVFLSAVGIVLTHAYGNDVSHNHIHDLFYTAISSGWVWGYADSVSRNNKFEKNHIHHLGQGVLSDMGGIYLLGVQPDTVVRGNLIYDIEKSNYGGWAIYTDEGSSYIVIENNICYNTSSQGFHQHYGRENSVRNNIFAFSEEGQIAITRVEGHNSFTFMRNIVIARNQPIFAMNPDKGKHFISDANLYWDVSGETNLYRDDKDGYASLEVWKAVTGNDRNSLVADPCFENVESNHFKLKKESPAYQLGFKDIEMGDIGPRL